MVVLLINEGNADTNSLKIKEKIKDQTGNNVEIMVPLKYLSILCRTLETPLINHELILDQN